MSGDPSDSLIRAVRGGNVETAKTLIDTFGLSYSTVWSNGYVLLRIALNEQRKEMTKLLLLSGSKVNSKSKRPTETPLHIAVRNRYTEIVSMLLDRGADVHAVNGTKQTPLDCAIQHGSPEIVIVNLLVQQGACINAESLFRAVGRGQLAIVDELLNHGANVNTRCTGLRNNGYTPLHCAAEEGNEPMVKLLVSNGAEVNATDGHKRTPLHIATNRRSEKIVKFLLENSAYVDACDEKGKTTLQVAVEEANLTTIEHILHFCPDVNSKANRSSLYTAINGSKCDNSRKVVDALLRYGFTVRAEDAKDTKFLHAAVEGGYLKIVEALLKLGADVNTLHSTKKGVTLLHTAALYRQIEIAELLLSHGANVNAQDDMRKLAICYAIENNDTSITKLLSSGSASVEVTMELLHTAVKKGNREIVEILLQLSPNIDINACDKFGRTVLHYMARNDDLYFSQKSVANEETIDARAEMAKMFLGRGACINAKTKDGTTALHFAAEGGYDKVVEVLLENKADVNSLTEQRTHSLHLAVKRDNETIVKMLLDCGANVNVRQLDGTTALHTASTFGREDIVKLLVERGADLDAKDKEKPSPLCLAVVNNHSNVVEALLKHGASVDSKDKLGKTALHHAARLGLSTVINVLLNYGADINVTCKHSLTPLNYAILKSKQDKQKERELYDENAYYERYGDCYRDRCGDCYADHYGDRFDDYDDDYDHVYTAILKRHIVTMKALGLYVSDKNLSSIDLDDNILEDCQMEIANMRTKKIGDSNVSFYDVLTRGMGQLAVYAKNESIVHALESKTIYYEFPLYCGMITRRFKQGQKRESLLNSSLKSLNALSDYALPDLPAMELINYLSNKDLENLIKANPSTDVCDS